MDLKRKTLFTVSMKLIAQRILLYCTILLSHRIFLGDRVGVEVPNKVFFYFVTFLCILFPTFPYYFLQAQMHTWCQGQMAAISVCPASVVWEPSEVEASRHSNRRPACYLPSDFQHVTIFEVPHATVELLRANSHQVAAKRKHINGRAEGILLNLDLSST